VPSKNIDPVLLHALTAHWTVTEGTCEMHEAFLALASRRIPVSFKIFWLFCILFFYMALLMWDIFCRRFGDLFFCDACSNGHFCSTEYISQGYYNHLPSVTNKRLLISSLAHIAALIMSASAHRHDKTIGTKIQGHSLLIYTSPFLLVIAQRITSLVT
jgi:hypothetical protein